MRRKQGSRGPSGGLHPLEHRGDSLSAADAHGDPRVATADVIADCGAHTARHHDYSAHLNSPWMSAALRYVAAGNDALARCYAFCRTSNRGGNVGTRRGPATVHTCVKVLSFSAVILGLARRTCFGWSSPRPNIRKEMIMFDRERDLSPADDEAILWPSDILQSAFAVIATTRYEWASRGGVDDTAEDRTCFADPLFRLGLDAVSSRAGRARGVRARARRRTSGQFAW